MLQIAVEICFLTACSTEKRVRGGGAFHRQVEAGFVILRLLQKLYLIIIQGTRPCSFFPFYQIMKNTRNLTFYLRDVVLLLCMRKTAATKYLNLTRLESCFEF